MGHQPTVNACRATKDWRDNALDQDQQPQRVAKVRATFAARFGHDPNEDRQ
jgi:hypothetical protein